jgi:ketosteroid isomerase-like protein
VDARELVALEELFWRAAGDRDAYASHLAGDALHVFPGWGVAERGAVLDGVAAAAPWTSFSIDEPRLVPLGDDAAALVYTARARRAGDEYRAAVTSVYRRHDGGWRLVVHQQTPL